MSCHPSRLAHALPPPLATRKGRADKTPLRELQLSVLCQRRGAFVSSSKAPSACPTQLSSPVLPPWMMPCRIPPAARTPRLPTLPPPLPIPTAPPPLMRRSPTVAGGKGIVTEGGAAGHGAAATRNGATSAVSTGPTARLSGGDAAAAPGAGVAQTGLLATLGEGVWRASLLATWWIHRCP